MSKFISFRKIGQFRNIIREISIQSSYIGLDNNDKPIYDSLKPKPTIEFNGTVKLHGTNASVCFNKDEVWFQSRKSKITPEKDNAAFAFFANNNIETFKTFHKCLLDRTNHRSYDDVTICIFGEWCGGNIQSGIALNSLEKMFVIFAIKVVPNNDETYSHYLEKDKWLNLRSTDNNIYNINDFDSFKVNIDFEQPHLVQNKIVELVESVEKECPVGKKFGMIIDKDNTTGEGIVWTGWYNNDIYMFKTKGEKHSVTKVKTMVKVSIEKLNSINEFIEYAVTENRLNQAIEQIFTLSSEVPNIKKTGELIKWIMSDIVKEECDTLKDNNLEPKDVAKDISIKVRNWFFNLLDKQSGLK